MTTATPRTRRAAALAATLVLAATGAGLAAALASAAPTAATTLVVNANQALRPVTHVASGSLYGLASSTSPSDSLVQALKPNTFVQMAPGGSQLPNGEPAPAGDALKVAGKAVAAGAKVVVRMPDWYPNFPYRWVGWSNWLSAVDTQVASVKASGATNISAYELWNEPDWTWDTTNAGDFYAGWTRTFNEVRSKDATTPIQGPSDSAYYGDRMKAFLQNAIATRTVPDVIAWYELSGSGKVAADVAAYRALEASLGLTPRPISIEEYGTTSEVGVPGPMIGYAAKFERTGVRDAEMAFWNHYGTLGDTLTDTGGSPNAAYWAYKWYGDMSGTMLVTTPSRGRTTAVTGPITISENDYAVSGGSLTVPVAMNAADGYHLVITPSGSSTTLAGTYRITNLNSGLRLDTQNSGTAQGTLVDQAAASSGPTQSWTLGAG